MSTAETSASRKRLRTEQQISKERGIPRLTLQNWRSRPPKRGGGPPYIKLGRSVRYDIDQFDQWLAANTIGNTAA